MAEAFAVSHPFLGKLSLSSLAPSQLVYMPYPSDPDEKFGHMEHHVTIRAKDGTELNGWYFDRGADKPLVVAYHGKGVHIGWAVEDAANDHSRSYLMINYRGYGDSQGVGLARAARSVRPMLRIWSVFPRSMHCRRTTGVKSASGIPSMWTSRSIRLVRICRR